jgi:hypothetical protein
MWMCECRGMKRLLPHFLLLLSCLPASAQPAAERLKADLLPGTSATQVLTDWCARLRLSDPPAIHAGLDAVNVPASVETRALLKVSAGEPLRYRRVKLACGSHVLSVADNWYVPSRLTPAMNAALDTTDTPFGAIVRPLNFHRQTLDADTVREAGIILRVRALLLTADNVPFSLVVENYTKELATGR